MRLARVGLEDAWGYLKGGIKAWREAGLSLATISHINVEALSAKLQRAGLQVLDVRREPEWEAGHIEGAAWWPLDNFKVSPPEIDRDSPIAVHCKGGYRSMIACSLLQRAGFQKVLNVVGGFDAWQQAKLSVVTEKPAEA
jgi:rhodanese-related sulfurtransferase